MEKIRIESWEFLLFSILILTLVLSFCIVNSLYSRQEELVNEIEELKDAHAQNILLNERVEESKDLLEGMKERLDSLEKMLLDLKRMSEIIEGKNENESAQMVKVTSRRQEKMRFTTSTMPLNMPSGIVAERFENAFRGTALEGIGEMLVFAENETGINSLVLAGIIVHETGWGSSRLAKEKNNLAGLNACGDVYNNAFSFDSRIDSIMFLGNLLSTKYCPGGKYFGGSFDLEGVGHKYAEDSLWAKKVAGCMKTIFTKSEA